MKITKQQLRKIVKEEIIKEALPPHLQKHFRKDGSSVHGPEIKDVTPAGYGPDDAEMDSQVSADDFIQISRRLSKLYRRLDDMDQQDEVMEIRKQLIALRKRVTGEQGEKATNRVAEVCSDRRNEDSSQTTTRFGNCYDVQGHKPYVCLYLWRQAPV